MTPVTKAKEAPGANAGAAPVTVEIFQIGSGLADEVKATSGASPMSCYQCAKCSSGCPVANRGDLKPHELVRLVQTNQRGAVLSKPVHLGVHLLPHLHHPLPAAGGTSPP